MGEGEKGVREGASNGISMRLDLNPKAGKEVTNINA